MTQQELADLLGITNKAVSKWETGEAFPETAQLVPLADVFGVTVDELLRGKRGETPPVVSGASASEAPMSDPATWRRTCAVLIVLSACAVLFAVAYLLSACLMQDVPHRAVIVRGSVCLLLMALAFAGSCVIGILLTQRQRSAPCSEALLKVRRRAIAGLLTEMVAVCLFVFFSLYALPEYANVSALIVGMTAGGAFAVAGAVFLVFALIAARSQNKRSVSRKS